MDISIFSERLKELRIKHGMSQTELGMKIGKTKESAQAYISKLEHGKLKPDFDSFCAIADKLDISLDWLIGKDIVQNTPTKVSPRDFCRMLSQLDGCYIYPKYTYITREELCIDPPMAWENCANCELRENEYQAIYFSEWLGANNREEETIHQQLGNHSERAASINLFISRLQKIKEMFLNGDLDQEMYDILLDKYVNDVPDK